MSIFKSFRLTWWQAGLLKISMISLGIIIGANVPDLFIRFGGWIWLAFAVPAIIVIYEWLKQ